MIADLADRRHADEVGRARQEAGEGRRERNRAARGQPHGRADHHLLGDEVLVEAIGQHLLELVAEGRVLHVGVERDDAGVGFAELGDRGAVRLARRDLVADLVGRRRHRFRASRLPRASPAASGSARARSTLPTPGHELLLELGQRAIELLALLERLAVPPVLAFDERHALALDRAGQNHRRLALSCAAPPRARRESPPGRDRRRRWRATRTRASGARTAPCRGCHIVGRLWPRPLTSVIPHRLSSPSMDADVGRFPHRAFGRFAVAEQHVGPVVRLDPPRVQRDADRRADALAERAGRHVDERQPRRRMAFEVRIDPPQLQQLGAVEGAGLGPRGVQNRRRVALRQHEAIAARDAADRADRTASRRRTAPP